MKVLPQSVPPIEIDPREIGKRMRHRDCRIFCPGHSARPNTFRSRNMPSQSNRRAATNARNEIFETLKEDHKRVKKAYREFSKLDHEADSERAETIVREVLADLELHSMLEEEFLYPAARDALAEPDLVDEAEVEHESARMLIEQLKEMDSEDEKFAARFTVLCEYVMHHVKEEEREMFPQLERARMDWETIAREMNERRAEMAPPEEEEDTGEEAETEEGRSSGGRGAKGGRGGRSSSGESRSGGESRARGGAVEAMGAEPGEATTSRRI
ncbi:MAG TPA: hemerythrin domain-containing protein [Burkholderiaceae bacterium]|nr:hemerythrin domain-containing protein [Burkholderiaceae bacterium]